MRKKKCGKRRVGELTKTEHRWMILLQLFSLSGEEGDEHKWVIPSAVSADTHKELTVGRKGG